MRHHPNFVKIARKLAILCLAFWLLPSAVVAKPTTPDQARQVVQGWLARDGRPLGAIMGQKVIEVQAFPDSQEKLLTLWFPWPRAGLL